MWWKQKDVESFLKCTCNAARRKLKMQLRYWQVAAIKSGILGVGKGAGKKVTERSCKRQAAIRSLGQVPPYF